MTNHNWLYSFCPTRESNYIALVGFCKQCRHVFQYVMPPEYEGYFEYDSKVPKYGCNPIEEEGEGKNPIVLTQSS